jgi:formamidopyrimidine-DNA glycosylase
MPELAEVETLMRYLKKNILDEEIISFVQNRNNLRYPLSPSLKKDSENSKIIDIERRAKFLNIKLDNHNSIIFHLGMSGRITVKSSDYTSEKHDHILISFVSGNKLIFNDARRFGMVYSCPSDEFDKQDFLKNMGIEPLTDEFDKEYLKSKLSKKQTSIKIAIMDSKTVVGVGNIYAAESLFVSKISPERIASSLTSDESSKLVIAIKSVLNKAIKAGGTTLKDFVNGDNKPGYFKQELNVYDRANKPCYICKEPIKKIKQAGRSSFFCTK